MIALLLLWLLLAPAGVGIFCALLGIAVGPASLLAVAVCAAVAWLSLRVVERT